MATITATGTGNWDDPTKWDLGRVPAAGDAVIVPSTYLVTIRAKGTYGVAYCDSIAVPGSGKVLMATTSELSATGTVNGIQLTGTGSTATIAAGTVVSSSSNYGIRTGTSTTGTLNLSALVGGGSGNSCIYMESPWTVNITGNIIPNSSSGITNASGGAGCVVNITGNVFGTPYEYNTNAGHGISIGVACYITVYGSVYGGNHASILARGIQTTSVSGTVTVIGKEIIGGLGSSAIGAANRVIVSVETIRGGSGPYSGSSGIVFSDGVGVAESVLNVSGWIEAGSGAGTATGISYGSRNTLTINGNVRGPATNIMDGQTSVGSAGVSFAPVAAGSVLNINGTVYGTRNGVAVSLLPTVPCTANIRKVVGLDYGYQGYAQPTLYYAVNSNRYVTLKIKQIEFGSYNCSPISGPFFLDNSDPLYPPKVVGYSSIFPGASKRLWISVSDVSAWSPPISSVAVSSGGTMVVPSASDVWYGVPVDSTTGTGTLSPDAILDVLQIDVDPNTVGERLATLPTISDTASAFAV